MNVSFRQLKAFVAVARLGNLGAAADQLCLFLEVNILELMELEDNFGLVATQGFKFLDIGYIDPRSRVVVEDKPKKKKNPPKDS